MITDTDKELYDLVHSKYHSGNDITEKYHIIETEEEWSMDDFMYTRKSFRVYHSDGYCFDISMIYDENLKQRDIILYSEWDGFLKVKDSEHAICLLK